MRHDRRRGQSEDRLVCHLLILFVVTRRIDLDSRNGSPASRGGASNARFHLRRAASPFWLAAARSSHACILRLRGVSLAFPVVEGFAFGICGNPLLAQWQIAADE